MKRNQLRHIINRLEDLPTLSPVAERLIRMTLDEESSFQDVARIIEMDQALTARVLKVANSAFYGMSRKIATVKEALFILGFDAVKSIVLSISVIDLFRKGKERNRFNVEKFWLHCLACAICAKSIALKEKHSNPEEAFVAGLLHDIGKLVLFKLDEDFDRAVKLAEEKDITIIEAEREVFDIDHTIVGKWIVERWQFSPKIKEAIWLHHYPMYELAEESESSLLASIVHVSDTLCRKLNIGFGGDYKHRCLSGEILKKLGITEDDVQMISENLPDQISDMASMLGIDTGEGLSIETIQMANKELGRMSLMNERKNKMLERKILQLSVLQETSFALQSCYELDKILETLGGQILKGLDLHEARCYLYLEDGSILESISTEGMDRRISAKTSMISQEDFQRKKELAETEYYQTDIVVNNKPMGKILIQLKEEFGEGDVDFLSAFAKLGALAIERTNLYLQNKDKEEEMIIRTLRMVQEYENIRQQLEKHLSSEPLNNFLTMISHELRLL